MEKQIAIAVLWLSGFLLSQWMLKVEHQAEEQEYTNGHKTLAFVLSVFSYGMVLFILWRSWFMMVKNYWSKPVKPKSE